MMNPLTRITQILARRSRLLAAYQEAVQQRDKAGDERDQALDQVRTLRTELKALRGSHIELAGRLIAAEDSHRDDLRLLAEHTRTIHEMSALVSHQRAAPATFGHRPEATVDTDALRHILDRHINRRGDRA